MQRYGPAEMDCAPAGSALAATSIPSPKSHFFMFYPPRLRLDERGPATIRDPLVRRSRIAASSVTRPHRLCPRKKPPLLFGRTGLAQERMLSQRESAR